jgi:hypothetical protein
LQGFDAGFAPDMSAILSPARLPAWAVGSGKHKVGAAVREHGGCAGNFFTHLGDRPPPLSRDAPVRREYRAPPKAKQGKLRSLRTGLTRLE